MVPRVLLAFDGSPSARTAVERSAALFPGAEAVVVSVASSADPLAEVASSARVALPDEMIRTAVARLHEAALEETRELAAAGVKLAEAAGLRPRPEVVTADGPVWAAIADAAGAAEADVVVCGTHGYGAAARAILGSVSSGLVRHAGLPVLVVPDEAGEATGPPVIAFDDSEPAARAVAAAGRLFAGRAVVVLHVGRSPIRHSVTGKALLRAPLDEVREIAGDLERLFAEWRGTEAERGGALAREHGLEARVRSVESGDAPSHAILEAAAEEDAVAVVLGRRGRGAVASAVLGSVSSSILHAADRPVLVV